MLLCISWLVDFIKLFRSGDQKLHQDSRIDYSRVDMQNGYVTQENFDTTFGEEKKCSESTLTSMNVACDSDVEVDTNLPSMNSHCNADLEGAGLSSEVSAIYLAMKNSKLECVDEQGQDSMSTDVCLEDDDYEEFDDFDPYLFIKNLPELSSVVPTFRPMLLPKQTRSCPPTTLVLDLDGKENRCLCSFVHTIV